MFLVYGFKKIVKQKQHPFHILPSSPWPILTSFSVLVVAIGTVLMMHKVDKVTFAIGVGGLILALFGWWRDVIIESNTQNTHTTEVQIGLKIGFALFIVSEIMFFVAFFWSYFYSSMAAGLWPPKDLVLINPFRLPYLNTLILLLSGTTITWAHHTLLNNDIKNTAKAILYTVCLGAVFTVIQVFEYMHSAFSIKDGIYPSNFFLITGFHGFHVLVGSIFLFICFLRAKRNEFTPQHHVGFEAAAWYWHFVDVVWLFLFVSIYWFSYRPS